MHPQGFYSFVTSRKFIPIFIVIVIVVLIFFYGIETTSQRQFSNQQPFASPTPIMLQEQTKTGQNYTIEVPGNWSPGVHAVPSDPVKNFTYIVNGMQYAFTVLQPGQSNTEVSLMRVDTVELTTKNYDGRNFLRKLWIYQGKPFLIQAIPNEDGFEFNGFSMELPPVDTQMYISQFDTIMEKMQLPKEMQISPQPTLEGPRTIQVNQQQ